MNKTLTTQLCCSLLLAGCATTDENGREISQPDSRSVAMGAGVGIAVVLAIGLLGATLLSNAAADAITSK